MPPKEPARPRPQSKLLPIIEGKVFEEHLLDGEVIPCARCESSTRTTITESRTQFGTDEHVCVFCYCTPTGAELAHGMPSEQKLLVKAIAQAFNLLYWRGN